MQKDIASKYSDKFKGLLKLQDEVKSIHPLLHEHYPIAIVEDKQLHIFDYSKGMYSLSHTEPDTMDLPGGIRAAFPLACMPNQVAVVVTGDVFDTISEQVIMFHEFVHCYQYHTCEIQLREQIDLAKRSANSANYSWELNYPFPYSDNQFSEITRSIFDGLDRKDHRLIGLLRRKLKDYLTMEQVEYMVWQEWKEGLARYIENQVKFSLGIPLNHGGREEPYRRTTFYEMGSQLINLIVESSPGSLNRIEELYYALKNDKY